MESESQKCSYAAEGGSGADVVAACGPLQVIAASVVASHKNSQEAMQQACNLMATSKGFLSVLKGCRGMLPVNFGPSVTPEAAAGFAEWLAKYGILAGSLELQLTPTQAQKQLLSPSQQLSTELAVVAALQKAAAAGSNGQGALCIRACRLAGFNLNTTAVLQALPSSTLSSLDLDLHVHSGAAAADIYALWGRLATVLPLFQQLQQLRLRNVSFHNPVVSPMLQGHLVGGVKLEQLAAALGQMRSLRHLNISKTCRRPLEDATADAADAMSLAWLLRGLASRWSAMKLMSLDLSEQHVNRASASMLTKLHGLQKLELADCQLDDRSVSKIALALKPSLLHFDISRNPELTSACLPALVHALPNMHTSSTSSHCAGMARKQLEPSGLMWAAHQLDEQGVPSTSGMTEVMRELKALPSEQLGLLRGNLGPLGRESLALLKQRMLEVAEVATVEGRKYVVLKPSLYEHNCTAAVWCNGLCQYVRST